MNPRDDDDDDELWASLQGALGPDVTREPPAERVADVRAAAEQHRRAHTPFGAGRGRRELLVGGIAASVGALAGVALSREDDPPDVPLEAVAFAVAPEEATVSADLIDHTWGLETILTATGLPADRRYRTTYLLADDEEVEAGAFLGVADTTIVCRMNGPVRRDVVRAIEISDAESGDLVLRADLA